MSRKTIVAAVFGHPAWLRGHTRYTQAQPEEYTGKPFEHEAQQWMPGRIAVKLGRPAPQLQRKRITDGEMQKLRGRWVTVFRYDAREKDTRWFLELYVDNDRTIHVNPSKDRATRLDWSPAESKASGSPTENELPRHVAGRPWHYALIGTPFRLSDACLEKLEADNEVIKCMQPIDLARDQHVFEGVYYDGDGNKVVTHRDLALPVLLPFDVARQLAADITTYRSERANVMGQHGAVRRASEEQVESAKRYAFSHALDAIARHPDFKSDVDDDFSPAKLAGMRANMLVHEARLARLELAIETTADDVTRWLDRKLIRILIDGCESSDEHRLLEAMNDILPWLQESAIGMNYLEKTLRHCSRGGFYERYFEKAQTLSELAMGNARTAAGAFANLVATVISVQLLAGDYDVSVALQTLHAKFGSIGAGWELDDVKVRTEKLSQFVLSGQLKPGTDVDASFDYKLRVLVAKGEALKRIDGIVGTVKAGLNILAMINVAITIRTFYDTPAAEKNLRLERGIAAAVATASMLTSLIDKTFKLMGQEIANVGARTLMRFVGVIAAVHTLVTSAKTVLNAARSGDWDASAAMMTSMTLTLISSLLSVAAVLASESVFNVWALVLGLAGAAFYLLYLYLRDGPLEMLVSHSAFGQRAGEDSKGGRPSWSPIALSRLAGSWDHQITALATLREQFAVTFGNRAKIGGQVSPYYLPRILTGALDDRTQFRVQWRWDAQFGKGSHEQYWRPQAGKDAVSFARRLHVGDDKLLYFDVEAPPQVWEDSGYGLNKGYYGFRWLEVHVIKEWAKGPTAGRTPLEEAVVLRLRTGEQEPDTGEKKYSVEVK